MTFSTFCNWFVNECLLFLLLVMFSDFLLFFFFDFLLCFQQPFSFMTFLLREFFLLDLPLCGQQLICFSFYSLQLFRLFVIISTMGIFICSQMMLCVMLFFPFVTKLYR